jgi:UDP-glucuronate 4-epimerase
MLTVLVTGAAGFIGSRLTLRLLELGHHVIGIDNFDTFYSRESKEQNLVLPKQFAGFTFLEADITDLSTYQILSKFPINAIAHLAAKAGVRNSMVDPSAYNEVNVLGTSRILEYARVNGINKIAMASSSSVYGNNTNFPWKEADEHTLPASPYASSKKATEILAETYATNFGIDIAALRFFTVYGPAQRPDLAIYKFAKALTEQETITLYGDGSSIRNYTYVADIVEGTIAALSTKILGFEVFNLGSTDTISLADMLGKIEMALGTTTKVVYESLPKVDVPVTWPDLTKSKAILGYEPTTKFDDGLRHFLNWFKGENALQIA